jgi:hypothetical protein
MKSLLAGSTAFLAAVSLMAADKDDVVSAAQKLGGADNYSWTTTMDMGANSQFNMGPTHGKTQKDGLVWMDMTMQDNTMEAYAKGGKGAVKTEDGWQALDLTAAPGGGGGGFNPGMMMGMRLRTFKAPAAEVQDIVGKTKDITKTGDLYTGDLTEDGAKGFLTMGRGGRRGGGGGGGGGGTPPAVANAKGSVKIWVTDGVITKYQYKVSGTVSRGGNDMDVDRTTTVEIKDVGTTKLAVPDEAQKKMG